MFLAEPQPTGADLRFTLAGIPVRVSGWFWVAALLLGWGFCQALAAGDQRSLVRSLILWLGTVFVSILIHEMGHALAYRAFGQSATVVLYHFGGLSIPTLWGRRGARRPAQQFLVSAAGPFAQLAFAAVIVAILKAGGYSVPFPIAAVGERLGLYDGARIGSPLVFALVLFLLQVNIFWPILNLMPVPPLDGGQMVREGLLAVGVDDAHRIADVLGMGVGAVIAWWAYSRGEPFIGIMFAMLAVTCFQNVSDQGRWR